MGFRQIPRPLDRRLRCDGGCGRKLPAGAWAFECTQCDNDVCVACANDEDSERAVERGGRGVKRPHEPGDAPRATRARGGSSSEPRAGGESGSGQGGEAPGALKRKGKRKRQVDPGLEPGSAPPGPEPGSAS